MCGRDQVAIPAQHTFLAMSSCLGKPHMFDLLLRDVPSCSSLSAYDQKHPSASVNCRLSAKANGKEDCCESGSTLGGGSITDFPNLESSRPLRCVEPRVCVS
jgi:hypothetical protein